MNNRNSKKDHNVKLVPVTFNGNSVMIDANSISKKDRTMHHGATKSGVVVNSAQSYTIGDSTIVWPSDGAPAVSFLNSDLEVFATQILQKLPGQQGAILS
ncbi:MAG: hypothetical protein ACYCZZ_03285 [Minisyncoccota bacterium]